MSAQLAVFLAWASGWAPMFTAAAGGGLALTSTLLLFLIAIALEHLPSLQTR